jgi:Fur family ferric uptake transcriptional regulator
MERQTRQRQAIRDAITRSQGPVSPREVLSAAGAQVAGLGMATIYRTLKSMLDAGELVQVDVPGGAPRYELAGKRHHHHFHCRVCQRMYEVDGCPGDLTPLAPPGFVLESHNIVLNGVCAACERSKRDSRT